MVKKFYISPDTRKVLEGVLIDVLNLAGQRTQKRKDSKTGKMYETAYSRASISKRSIKDYFQKKFGIEVEKMEVFVIKRGD